MKQQQRDEEGNQQQRSNNNNFNDEGVRVMLGVTQSDKPMVVSE